MMEPPSSPAPSPQNGCWVQHLAHVAPAPPLPLPTTYLGVSKTLQVFDEIYQMPRITQARTARGVTSPRLRTGFSEPRFIRFKNGYAAPRSDTVSSPAAAGGPHGRLARRQGPGAARTWHPGGWACGRMRGTARRVGEARPAPPSREARGACVGGEPRVSPQLRNPGDRAGKSRTGMETGGKAGSPGPKETEHSGGCSGASRDPGTSDGNGKRTRAAEGSLGSGLENVPLTRLPRGHPKDFVGGASSVKTGGG